MAGKRNRTIVLRRMLGLFLVVLPNGDVADARRLHRGAGRVQRPPRLSRHLLLLWAAAADRQRVAAGAGVHYRRSWMQTERRLHLHDARRLSRRNVVYGAPIPACLTGRPEPDAEVHDDAAVTMRRVA